MKRGFTLVEMLVVIGIIAVLIGASVAAYGPITRQAQRARGQELVSNVKDALEFILQKEDEWPLAIRKAASGSDGQVTAEVCSSPRWMVMTRMASLHSGILTFSNRFTRWLVS